MVIGDSGKEGETDKAFRKYFSLKVKYPWLQSKDAHNTDPTAVTLGKW